MIRNKHHIDDLYHIYIFLRINMIIIFDNKSIKRNLIYLFKKEKQAKRYDNINK